MDTQKSSCVQILARSNNFFFPFLLNTHRVIIGHHYIVPLFVCLCRIYITNTQGIPWNIIMMTWNIMLNNHGQCLMTFINFSEFHFKLISKIPTKWPTLFVSGTGGKTQYIPAWGKRPGMRFDI